MSWQASSLALLALALAAGFAWYEREKPPARVLAVVAALAALAVVGRLAFAAFPNVKPTTDIVLFAGYALGAVPGFAVGAVTAIVSNIFLSQGPWTVWQMAGWGAVGVGGAVLARVLRGREPNRFVLAAVCGVAGLLFGAWMDIYQWTFAARQDLDTYIAVAGTSLPYNIAHAVGNVVFCLLLGPAFLRALARYRRRLEVRWERSPAPIVASAIALALVLALPAMAAAATPAKRAETYLLRAQNKDGGFGAAPEARLEPALHRLDRPRARLGGPQPARREAQRWTLGGRVRACAVAPRSGDIGEIERTVLLARAAGMDPRSFGGRNLLAEIEKRRRGDGSISGFVSYTAFGIMALRASGASAGSATVRWLVGSQNGDGGFGVARASSSDSDMTGAALQALATVGRAHGGAAAAGRELAAGEPERRRRLRAVQGTRLQLAVDLVRDPGPARGGCRRRRGLARADIPRPPPAKRRERRLLVVERADARVGDRPGADGAGGQAPADRGRAEEQADAREGGVRRTAEERPLREAAARPARSRARAAARQRRAARARQPRATPPPGAVGGATAAGEPAPTDPESTTALAAAAPESGAAHPKPVPVWAALARGGRPARAPVGDPQVRAAWALARHGIVRP